MAVSPTSSRIALCTMCVAVWARLIARRRSTSTLPTAASPGLGRPFDDSPAMHDETVDGLLDVVDLDHRTIGQSHRAAVGKLTAALGVERGAIENDLDLGSSIGRCAPPRRRAGSRAARPRWRARCNR